MTTRRVSIYNGYELYDSETVEKEIEVPGIEPGESVEDYLERINDELFDHTGVGHTDGNSFYEMESIDGLEPQIKKEWGG